MDLLSEWIFSVKHKVDDSIEQFKARLVAQRYTQLYNIEYQEIFAHAVSLNTIRVLLSIAANLDWPLYQLKSKGHGSIISQMV